MSEEKLDTIIEKLNEISKWTKFQGLDKFKQTLLVSLKTDNERAAYELSDGVKTTREIAKEIGINSKSTIVAYWQKWNKLGIVDESQKFTGRMKHLVSLEEVGIELPTVLRPKKTPKVNKNE